MKTAAKTNENITITKNGKTTAFVHPAYGPGTFKNVMSQIDHASLLRPTTSQIVSLVYHSFQNQDVPKCKEVIKILKNEYLWTATENLWVPKEGVFVFDNVGGKMPFDKKSLERMLEKDDKRVRFVPFGFKTNEQSLRQFAKNPYVIAHVGEENADAIAEIAGKFYQPKVWGFESINSEFHGYTALAASWDDWRFHLAGFSADEEKDGFTFGWHKGKAA